MAHHRVWLFRPEPGRESEFERAYSSGGDWAQLFGKASGYIGTRLMRPAQPSAAWLTIDSWECESDFERFQDRHGAAYGELDRQLEGLCVDERFVGAFND